jgi:putative glycerol-1-phosphate prenyltransferase
MKKKFQLKKGDTKIALLIDPDWAIKSNWLLDVLSSVNNSSIDVILIGGSLVINLDKLDEIIITIKKITKVPVYLFPGHPTQISKYADGILFLSLISGRNPELLIGQHVISAPMIKSYNLNVIPTGYMIMGNDSTSVHYMSQTHPLPANKPDIAIATALAGEMLGLQCIYLDGGSGANESISENMIQSVSGQLSVPLIVGGGINHPDLVKKAFNSGADMVVVGTAIEKMPEMLECLNERMLE